MRRGLGPTKLDESWIADAKMMSHLMEDGLSNLRAYLFFIRAHPTDRGLVEGDAIRHHAAITLHSALRERNPLIETEEVATRRLVFDDDRDIVNSRGEGCR